MSIKINPKELNFSFTRSSGSGGQNVNKVNSKVVMKWTVSSSQSLNKAQITRFLTKYKNKIDSKGDFSLSSQRYRDQPRNIADCIQKLYELVEAIAKPQKRRIPTKPSKSTQKKRIESKKRQSEKKRNRQKY